MSQELRDRFIQEIKLRAYDDQYVDVGEEKEILKTSIELGIDIDTARIALQQVCEQQGYLLESAILKEIKSQVEVAAGNDGKVDEGEFSMIFQNAQAKLRGKKNDIQVKRMIVTIMEDNQLNQVKTGWFSNWYTKLKGEIGMS